MKSSSNSTVSTNTPLSGSATKESQAGRMNQKMREKLVERPANLFGKRTKSMTDRFSAAFQIARTMQKANKKMKRIEERFFEKKKWKYLVPINRKPRARSFDQEESYFHSLSQGIIKRAKKIKERKLKGILKKNYRKQLFEKFLRNLDKTSEEVKLKKKVTFNLEVSEDEDTKKPVKSTKTGINPHPCKRIKITLVNEFDQKPLINDQNISKIQKLKKKKSSGDIDSLNKKSRVKPNYLIQDKQKKAETSPKKNISKHQPRGSPKLKSYSSRLRNRKRIRKVKECRNDFITKDTQTFEEEDSRIRIRQSFSKRYQSTYLSQFKRRMKTNKC